MNFIKNILCGDECDEGAQMVKFVLKSEVKRDSKTYNGRCKSCNGVFFVSGDEIIIINFCFFLIFLTLDMLEILC